MIVSKVAYKAQLNLELSPLSVGCCLRRYLLSTCRLPTPVLSIMGDRQTDRQKGDLALDFRELTV